MRSTIGTKFIPFDNSYCSELSDDSKNPYLAGTLLPNRRTDIEPTEVIILSEPFLMTVTFMRKSYIKTFVICENPNNNKRYLILYQP